MKKIIYLLILVFFMQVQVKAQNVFPEQLYGNWLSPQNNEWKFGFFEHFAIVEGKFWTYKVIHQKKNSLEMRLKNGNNEKKLYITLAKDNRAKIGFSKKEVVSYTRQRNRQPEYAHYDTTGFKLPLLQPGTFRLSGVINGYNRSRPAYKYAKVIYNHLLEPGQKTYIVPLDSLGRFTVEFPLLNPQEIMFGFGYEMKTFYAVPGSSLMMCLNQDNEFPPGVDYLARNEAGPDIFFMGPEGMLNTEINDYFYNLDMILDPEVDEEQRQKSDQLAYKKFRIAKMEDQLLNLGAYAHQHHSSKRFVQQLERRIKYHAAEDLLRYSWLKDPKKIPLTDDYLTFQNMLPANDRLSLLTDHYSAYLKQIFIAGYAGVPPKKELRSILISEVIDLAKKTGFKFDPADEAYLKEKEPGSNKTYLSKADTLKCQALYIKYGEGLKAGIHTMVNQDKERYENAAIGKVISTEKGSYSKAIIKARMAGRTLNENQVLEEKELARYKEEIDYPEVYAAVALQNNNLKEKLASNLPASTNIINPLKGAQDKLLESLVSKYAGKVIYIDFWAPWCGPCMSEMPSSKVLKKELAGKDVVFLYLGVECTQESWEKTIKVTDLAGEHYLLSKDEYTLLSEQFGIEGIPHYLLIDKEGKVANDNAQRPSEQIFLVKEINQLLKN